MLKIGTSINPVGTLGVLTIRVAERRKHSVANDVVVDQHLISKLSSRGCQFMGQSPLKSPAIENPAAVGARPGDLPNLVLIAAISPVRRVLV